MSFCEVLGNTLSALWSQFSSHGHFHISHPTYFMSSADNPKLQMCVIWRNAKQNNMLPLMVYFHGFRFVDHSLLMGWKIFSGSQLKKRREEVHLRSYLVRFVVSRHPPPQCLQIRNETKKFQCSQKKAWWLDGQLDTLLSIFQCVQENISGFNFP